MNTHIRTHMRTHTNLYSGRNCESESEAVDVECRGL